MAAIEEVRRAHGSVPDPPEVEAVEAPHHAFTQEETTALMRLRRVFNAEIESHADAAALLRVWGKIGAVLRAMGGLLFPPPSDDGEQHWAWPLRSMKEIKQRYRNCLQAFQVGAASARSAGRAHAARTPHRPETCHQAAQKREWRRCVGHEG